MLMRAVRLQEALQHWFEIDENSKIQRLRLDDVEWQQIRYVIQLTKPFALPGYIVSTRDTPSINQVFSTYNALFDHLDDEKAKLGRKKKTWKKELMLAIEAAVQKLKNYYNPT
ncbi:MAG: hypothetical protein M1823_008665, partial [Watsoniomyces obsoletus]